jgi:hypothetical protein
MIRLDNTTKGRTKSKEKEEWGTRTVYMGKLTGGR